MSTLWIAGAILVVVIIRRFSRLLGSALGMVLSVLVGGWGIWVYRHGGGLNLVGFEITAPAFMTLLAIWLGLEWLQLRQELKRRKAPPRRLESDSDNDAGDDGDEAENESGNAATTDHDDATADKPNRDLN